MRMLVIVYGGGRPDLVPDLLDAHAVAGWTALPESHGAGRSGRREGSRAWPGATRVFFTVADDRCVAQLSAALRRHAAEADAGERLHVAELPVERFF